MNKFTKLNEEEKIELAKKDWSTPDMVTYVCKKYDYYRTEDGIYIEVEKANSLGITKTMYYDDEYEAPEKNFENFLQYNDTVFRRFEYFEKNKDIVNVYWLFTQQNRKLSYIEVFTDWEMKDNIRYNFTRELTQEEKEEYLEILKERNDLYLERLKKYYKRYGNHITTYGYWANR